MPVYAITGQLCAGKHTVADWLCDQHACIRILVRSSSSSTTSSPLSEGTSNGHLDADASGDVFRSPTKSRRHGILEDGANTQTDLEHGWVPSPGVSKSVDDQHRPIVIVQTVEQLLDFVTKNWRRPWVTTDVQDLRSYELLSKRPFFLLFSVESPLLDRFARFGSRCRDFGKEAPGLEEFVRMSDDEFYGVARHESRSQRLSSSSPEHDTQQREIVPGLSQLKLGHMPPSSGTLERRSDTHASVGTNNISNHADSRPQSLTGTAPIFYKAALRIVNDHSSLSSFHNYLASLDLTSSLRQRPSWDGYFMSLSQLASLRSNCMKRRVGCVLVRNNRVIATGYNGTPRGVLNCNEGGCERCNSGTEGGAGLSTCLCLHAEENALLEAGRERISPHSYQPFSDDNNGDGGGRAGDGGGGSGARLYCNTCPCLTCAVKIAQVGVKEVIYNMAYSMDDKSASILREAGVVLRQFSPPYDD